MGPRKIYELLKEKIIWLDLEPESVLNTSELAKSFKVSRTPIKEALIYLESEGWLLRHGSHFIVTPLSLDRIKEITEIRSVMELQANIWAMHRITAEGMTSLCELEKEIQTLDDGASNKQMIELDVKFHRKLFHAAKNSQLAQLLDRLLSQYLRFWLSIPREIDPQSFFAETIDIIRAIKEKDEIKLGKATAGHIKHSVDEIMGTF